MNAKRNFRGAHASRVLATASRRRGLSETSHGDGSPQSPFPSQKVRFGGTPKPARGTRALPGLAAALALFPTLALAADAALDARSYPGPAWSPYIVGAGIGVLSWLTFYFSDKPIGASSFYATLAGLIGKLFSPKHTEQLAYFKTEPPTVNWGFIFVLATIGGAVIAALTGGEFANEWVPQMWSARFGGSIALRGIVAFAGGVLMAFGARLAGGCTSGHGISGTMQLNVASWIAVACFFIGGIAVAMLLFHI